MTRTCCATAGCHGCSTRCGPIDVGVFLRAFTFGHVHQLDAVAARLLARLCAAAPLLRGRDRLAYLDIDDTIQFLNLPGGDSAHDIQELGRDRPVVRDAPAPSAAARSGDPAEGPGAHRRAYW